MATCVVRLSPTLLRKAADRRAEGRALERRAVKISNIFFSCLRKKKKKKKGKAGHTSRAQATSLLHVATSRIYFQVFFFYFLPLPFLSLPCEMTWLLWELIISLNCVPIKSDDSGGVSSASIVTFDSYRVSSNSINSLFFFFFFH